MNSIIECKSLTKQYGSLKAVNQLSITLEPGKITGLIGRNGAGKTTLLKMIAGYLLPSDGSVQVFGETPFNSLHVSANLIFVDDNMVLPPALTLGETLDAAATFYEYWDHNLAMRLLEYFNLHRGQYHNNLSKGMKSTFNMILGIASRCALTIFDEPTIGMDAAVRKDFYRALLKDFMQHPRTVILSSHLLNEINDILDDVLLIKEGEKYLHMPIDELKVYAIGFTGTDSVIEQITKNVDVFYRKRLGKDSVYVAVRNLYTEEALQSVRLQGVEISAVATDDLCVYLTARHKGGIDDVFDGN